MAKAKYFNLLNEDVDLSSFFAFDNMELQDGATTKKTIYINSETGDKLVLSGKSLL